MSRLRVAVFFGGVSSEYEISLLSASSILNNLSTEEFEIVMVGITRDGRWLRYTGPVEEIAPDRWEQTGKVCPAILSPDRSQHGLWLLGESPELIKLDVLFPVLHGKNGEDGTIQGLFELSGIPYVGCGVLSSSVCMDKTVTHAILDHAGIPTARWACIFKEDLPRLAELEPMLREKLGYPMFIKPANAGSSVGVGKAHDLASLRRALECAFVYDGKVVVEEAIDGIEVECAVFGNEEPYVSALGEIVPKHEFYDYDAKYSDDSTELYIPARVSEEDAELVRQTARKAYVALGCAGLTRIDFFIKRDGSGIILNEPNTLPGFTSISMYPKLMEYSGTPYPQLLSRLVRLALQPHN